MRTRMAYMRGSKLESESMNVVGVQEAPSMHTHAVGQKGGHEPPPLAVRNRNKGRVGDRHETAVLS